MDVYSDDWDTGASLDADNDGSCLKTIVDALNEGKRRVRAAMGRGMPTAEFETAKAVSEGYDAAIAGIEAAWRKRRKS